MYPIPPDSKKQVLGAIKPSVDRCHKRLGHPSFQIVHCVLSKTIYLFLVRIMLSLFVMLVNKLRVINFRILSPPVFLKHLWILFFPMCGDRLLILLVEKITM
jgi:hypothetical protein